MEVYQVIILEDIDKTITLPKLENFNEICRLCLVHLSTSSKTVNDIEDRIKISSLLQVFTSIKVPENNDYLPQNICGNCIKFLIDMQIFRSRCLVNEDVLHKILKQDKNNWKLNKTENVNKINKTKLMTIINNINEERMRINNQRIETNEEQITIKDEQNIEEQTKVKEETTEDITQIDFSYACNMCDLMFRTGYSLQVHHMTHDSQVVKQFNIKKIENDIESKMRKSVTCPHCYKRFPSHDMKIHIQLHKEKLHSCDICNASFFLKNSLERHMKKHTNEASYECSICGQVFRVKYCLQVHQLTHEGQTEENIFSCVICEERFEEHSDLQHHLRSHNNRRVFMCEICGESFLDLSTLKAHERNCDGLTCNVCQKEFTSLRSKVRHAAEMHPIIRTLVKQELDMESNNKEIFNKGQVLKVKKLLHKLIND